MKHIAYCLQPKTLSLAVSAALTGIGLAMTLVEPARADLTIPLGTITTQYSGGGIITISSGAALSISNISNYAIQNTGGPITSLINQGVIRSWNNAAISNVGSIATIINGGEILSEDSTGILNNSTNNITSLTNSNGGLIYGAVMSGGFGVHNNGGTIEILNNSGTIEGATGIVNDGGGTIGTLSNSGTIWTNGGNGNNGIYNEGVINTLSNSNSGTIAGFGTGVVNGGRIGTLNNAGSITGYNNGVVNNGTIIVLSNVGTIIGYGNQDAYGIGNSGTIGTLSNNSIGYIWGAQTGIYNSSIIGTLSNSGSILGGDTGIINSGSGTIGTLSNGGVISGERYGVYNSSKINVLNNSGSILTTGSSGAGIYSSGSIGVLSNSGTINGISYGIVNTGTISSLINSNTGTITTSGSGNDGIHNTGTIGTLINTGSISGGMQGRGINNGGIITILTNGQSSLSYYGTLPINYNTYFTSNSSYGSTVFYSPSGSISTYGIQLAPTGVTLLANHVYTSVLSSSSTFNVASAYVNTVLTYSANGYSVTYELVPGSGHSYNLDILSFSCSGSCSGSTNNNSNSGGITPSVIAQHNNPAYFAARVIDANSTLSNLFSGVSGTAAQSAAASQSLPLVTGGATSVTQTALTSVNTIIDARQSANRGASSGDDFQTNRNMWLKAFGTEADQSDLDGVSGFKAHTGGVTFGADQKINDKLTLGAAFAYANSNVSSTVGGAPHGINIKGYQLIGYGSLALNNRDSVDFQLDGGMSNNSGTRDINFADVVASSSYNSWAAHLGSSLNRRYDLSDRLTLTPSLRVDYTRINESGYQESGAGDFDLNVDSQHAEALVLGVDGKLDYTLSDKLALAANLGVGYDAMNKQDSIIAAYAGAPNASFITEGLNQGALISRAGVVLSYKLPKGMEVSAHYDVEGRRNYLSQTASVKFSMPF